ncbi:MAG TPA: hypothetical protein PK528_06590 [Syntrophorhabdus sp.]|jgi:hypothetical protein|nr:hypothetical protein [Syntrophorhabdus sp.]
MIEARCVLVNEKGDKASAVSGSQETAVQVEKIRNNFWEAVRKTINKFREHPCYFFTESDIVSYFYSCFYSSSFECLNHENKRIYLAHREYPTNFRYDKDKLIDNSFEPYALNGKDGSRGNYDFAVLSPDFVKNARTVEEVVNKNIQLLLERTENSVGRKHVKELLFTVEFKYIINNSKNFVDEIIKDNRKLEISEKDQSELGLNLVFCNVKPHYEQRIRHDAVQKSRVINIFINSYYQEGNHKITPRPVANQKLRDYIQAHPSLFAKAFWKSMLNETDDTPRHP